MRISINNKDWEIARTDDPDKLMRTDGTVTLGMTDINDRTIYLWSGLSEMMFRKVLLHELSHAFINSYGIYLNLEEEEILCSFVDTYSTHIIEEADFLMQLLKREPSIF